MSPELDTKRRNFVILLSLIGLAPAYKTPATILQIATQTFTGPAVLFPTEIFGIPLWVGCFVVLSALQTVVMVYLIRKEHRAATDPR